MKTKTLISLIIISTTQFFAFGQESEALFAELENKNFFRARELYHSGKVNCQDWERKFIEASLENAFNNPEKSNRITDSLLMSDELLQDSMLVHALQLKIDNDIKLFEYGRAAETIDLVMNKYASFLTEEELADLANSFTLWNLLRNEAKQVVHIPKTVKQKM